MSFWNLCVGQIAKNVRFSGPVRRKRVPRSRSLEPLEARVLPAGVTWSLSGSTLTRFSERRSLLVTGHLERRRDRRLAFLINLVCVPNLRPHSGDHSSILSVKSEVNVASLLLKTAAAN